MDHGLSTWTLDRQYQEGNHRGHCVHASGRDPLPDERDVFYDCQRVGTQPGRFGHNMWESCGAKSRLESQGQLQRW